MVGYDYRFDYLPYGLVSKMKMDGEIRYFQERNGSYLKEITKEQYYLHVLMEKLAPLNENLADFLNGEDAKKSKNKLFGEEENVTWEKLNNLIVDGIDNKILIEVGENLSIKSHIKIIEKPRTEQPIMYSETFDCLYNGKKYKDIISYHSYMILDSIRELFEEGKEVNYLELEDYILTSWAEYFEEDLDFSEWEAIEMIRYHLIYLIKKRLIELI